MDFYPKIRSSVVHPPGKNKHNQFIPSSSTYGVRWLPMSMSNLMLCIGKGRIATACRLSCEPISLFFWAAPIFLISLRLRTIERALGQLEDVLLGSNRGGGGGSYPSLSFSLYVRSSGRLSKSPVVPIERRGWKS